MDQRISFFTIGVRNLEMMKNFYNKVFGWSPIKDSDGIVFYKLNGFIFSLFPVDELAEDISIHNDGKGFKQVSLAINLDSEKSVDTLFNDLVSKGAISVKKPEKVLWGGYRGYISDIENNYWELAYNPYLKMDETGNVEGHR